MATQPMLLLLLLISLFFLPSLRGVAFEDCGYGDENVNVTSVDIIRDKDQTSFKISGSLYDYQINGGQIDVRVVMVEGFVLFEETFKLCECMPCPVAPGAFVLPLDRLEYPQPPRKLRVEMVGFAEDNPKTHVHIELFCIRFEYENSPSEQSLLSQVG